MNLSLVILFFLPMLLDVVYSDESTHEISSFRDTFPDFTQAKDEMKKLKKGVAFSAKLTNDISNAATGSPVIFGTVHLNQGEAYDVSSGIFWAPSSGIYQFTVNTCTQPTKVNSVFLMKEGEVVDFTFAGSSTWSCAAITTIVSLQEQERVWVEMKGHPSGMCTESEKYVQFFSGFSGVYIGEYKD